MGHTVPPVNQHPFLAGGGTMGELIRNFSWDETLIGDPSGWPPSLKNSVSIMLHSPFPMHITWGGEFLQLYNDAYRPILGTSKHPRALGIPIYESFPEIWDTVGPMFYGVMKGTPVRMKDFKVFLDRKGYMEECYFDFAYSPILDELGEIRGVLTNVLETTDKVKAFVELENTREELRASEFHVIQQRDRLMEFFMDSPAGICILDGPDLRFTMVNPLYQQFFPGRELIGKTVIEAIPEISNDRIIDILDQVLKTGKTYHGIDELIPMSKRYDGAVEDRFFDLTYQARFDEKMAVSGIMVFAIEVTERKREEIRKNEFIEIVSHELKTPLTSLTAIVQIAESKLQKGLSDSSFLIEAMSKAGSQLKRMSAMIGGFLNVSRLESAQIHLGKTIFDFTQLVIDAMDELQLSSSGHQLEMDCRDVHMLEADREKMISVVTNLMANAVKYSPEGGKIIMDCSKKENELIFSVKDSGIGILPEDTERIFERYYRVSSSVTKNISGFGIGLYLSAQIVKLHGGRIWVDSKRGVGSVFSVSLPLSH
ncbi:ATP-binding protein [Pedobacter agri]|uniref:PAS domain-containing sensor histidine kinase n=1 Tax=Pedobacter agri TaxID=454586 RepID=UPI00292EBAAC|nr:ATP-binding protein [Pedobacter agri]